MREVQKVGGGLAIRKPFESQTSDGSGVDAQIAVSDKMLVKERR